MIPVEEAERRITERFSPVSTEVVALPDALGRVLAEDVAARITQPPTAVSAMDGYAVRASDVAEVPAVLTRIGEAPAGTPFEGSVGPGETVRIFTGGPLPDGADAVVMQEDTEVEGNEVTVREVAEPGRFVRPAGLDFRAGEVGLAAGRVLTARDVGLAAAMDVPWLTVRRRPIVAILATGDELVMPGEPRTPNQIVSSSGLALAGAVSAWGGVPRFLGIARDTPGSLKSSVSGAPGADLFLTTGGASVGEHDLVQSALADEGLEIDFWKIAMRPGKPLIFGALGETPFLGLPGNPVSSLVCALVFLKPVLDRLLGIDRPSATLETASLAADLQENDRRQDYLRATLSQGAGGDLRVTPFSRQDSSMLSRLAHADCLIVRPPHAPAAAAGEPVPVMRFHTDGLSF